MIVPAARQVLQIFSGRLELGKNYGYGPGRGFTP